MKVSVRMINELSHYSIEGVTFDNSLKTDRFIKDGHRTWRLTTHITVEGITFYSYGVTDLINPPGHGGEWSSRAEVINEVFGVNIIECTVDGWCCAIDKDEFSILNRALEYSKDEYFLCDIANDYAQGLMESGPYDPMPNFDLYAMRNAISMARKEFANKVIWM